MVILDNKYLSEGIESKDHFAATIGFFDGVHIGHQFVINKLTAISEGKGMKSMIITFANHPRQLLSPNTDFKLLSTEKEKISLLSQHNIDYCLNINFTRELSKYTSKEFMEILSQKFNVKILLVGYDHHFGSDINSTIDTYRIYGQRYGIEVIEMPSVMNASVTVSSSKIRKLLVAGNIETANNMLGYKYTLIGKIIHGEQLGRTIGFPTANLEIDPNKLIPQNGVYAARAKLEGKTYFAMLNIGNRPTVGGNDQRIEAHIINYKGNLYDKIIRLELISFIREEKKFDSITSLQQQIQKDKEKIIHRLEII